MSAVLLTGASGFIGTSALQALLARGHHVHACARRAGPPRERVTWHEVDLLAPGGPESLAPLAARADALLHLAWFTSHGAFWSARENELWIEATVRLLRCFAEAGGRRATIAGSCAEYAWGGQLLSERSTALEPSTAYGAAKHAAHLACAVLASELGLSLAWGRVFFLYGPGEGPQRLVSAVARGLLAGEQVPTTAGEQLRDFMHVRDVASALVALLEGEVSGPVNIATGHPVRVRDIVALIAAEAGGRERVRYGALGPRDGDPPLIAGDPRRLREEVGFHPSIGLPEGIAETVAWWRARMPSEAGPQANLARE